MKINKDELRILWYEDAEGNIIPHDSEACEAPKGAAYQVSQFPNELRTTYLELIRQEDVDQCTHPRKFIRPTYGWVDGVVGRECTRCGGHQVKKKWHFWPRKWDGHGSRKAFEGTCHWGNSDVILAMVASGDYDFSQAVIAYTTACERCMNVLAHKYLNGQDGYEEFSDEWCKANTVCNFCRDISQEEIFEQNLIWKAKQVPEVKEDVSQSNDTPVRRKSRSKRVPAVQELQETCPDGTSGEQLGDTQNADL